MPAERGRGLERDPGATAWWKHQVAVFGALGGEALDARHAHQACRDPLSLQQVGGHCADLDLCPGGDQNQVGRIGLAVGVAQDVSAALDRVARDGRRVPRRHSLAREREQRGVVS